MIISICVILPIIAFVVMIYVCRFYKSCHEEVGMFKDVDKEAEDRYVKIKNPFFSVKLQANQILEK